MSTFLKAVSPAERCDLDGVKLEKFKLSRCMVKPFSFFAWISYGSLYNKNQLNTESNSIRINLLQRCMGIRSHRSADDTVTVINKVVMPYLEKPTAYTFFFDKAEQNDMI